MSCKGYIRAILVPSRTEGFPFFLLTLTSATSVLGPGNPVRGSRGWFIWPVSWVWVWRLKILGPSTKSYCLRGSWPLAVEPVRRGQALYTLQPLPVLSRFHWGFPLPASYSGTEGFLGKAVGAEDDTRHPLPASLVDVSGGPPSWWKQGASFLLVLRLYFVLISHVSLYSKIPSLQLLAESYSEVDGALLCCGLWLFMFRQR